MVTPIMQSDSQLAQLLDAERKARERHERRAAIPTMPGRRPTHYGGKRPKPCAPIATDGTKASKEIVSFADIAP